MYEHSPTPAPTMMKTSGRTWKKWNAIKNCLWHWLLTQFLILSLSLSLQCHQSRDRQCSNRTWSSECANRYKSPKWNQCRVCRGQRVTTDLYTTSTNCLCGYDTMPKWDHNHFAVGFLGTVNTHCHKFGHGSGAGQTVCWWTELADEYGQVEGVLRNVRYSHRRSHHEGSDHAGLWHTTQWKGWWATFINRVSLITFKLPPHPAFAEEPWLRIHHVFGAEQRWQGSQSANSHPGREEDRPEARDAEESPEAVEQNEEDFCGRREPRDVIRRS